jgi:hypothetical protein
MTHNSRLITTVTVSLLVISYWLLVISPAHAETKLETKLENVKGQVENLVTAKDEKSMSELALRVETFKKVIEFSVSETKNLKIKLLALEGLSKEEVAWREKMIKEFDSFLNLYKNRETAIENARNIDIEGIKSLAADFKEWRETAYLPIAERVNEFLLIYQEENAVSIAMRRWARINEDITKLEKAKIKGVEDLRKLLNDAEKLIKEGGELNEKAAISFRENYIMTSTSTATSTEATPAARATTTEDISLESATSTPPIIQPPSIRDLVENSLIDIKDAYRVFIEMSNLVRKLLK